MSLVRSRVRQVAAVFALLTSAGCSDTASPPPSPSASSSSAGSSAAANIAPSSAPGPSGSAAVKPPTTSTERWGAVMLAGPGTPLQIEVTILPGDKPSGTISIPVQKVDAQPLEELEYTPQRIAFRMAIPRVPPPMQPRVELTRTGDTAKGTIGQQGVTQDVRFRLLKDGEHAGDRPQTPRPPYPYDERAASFESKDGTHLGGTLTIPKSAGPHPTVVLISGTGPQDRNSNLFGHQPFLVLADKLTRAGIAVLRVDDRGVGESKGNNDTANEEEKTEDVLAAMKWLSTQPGVDPNRIGLIGHSEGGVLAAMAASRASEPATAFVVLLASPGTPGAELLRTQMRLKLDAMKASKEQVDITMKAQNDAIDAVLRDASDADLEKIVTKQIDSLFATLPEADRKTITPADREGRIKAGLVQIQAPAMKAFIKSTPAKYLEKVKCPVLALGGSKDLQVPAKENLAGIESALSKGGNKEVTTQSFDGLNHLFQPAESGTMEEWAIIDETMDAGALDRITTWLTERAAAR